jgi:hypothetical protein
MTFFTTDLTENYTEKMESVLDSTELQITLNPLQTEYCALFNQIISSPIRFRLQ